MQEPTIFYRPRGAEALALISRHVVPGYFQMFPRVDALEEADHPGWSCLTTGSVSQVMEQSVTTLAAISVLFPIFAIVHRLLFWDHHRSKLRMRVALSLLFAALLLGCAHQPQWKCAGLTSPDQKLRACVSSVGKHGPPFNESRIEIHDVSDHVLAFKDFRSSDGEHGRNVQKNEWSPDSQFYIFSTASSGGHSPWHWQTYFYDRRANTFKEVDDFTGPIIKRDFTLSAPDWIEVTVQGTKSDPTDIVTGHKVKRQLSALH